MMMGKDQRQRLMGLLEKLAARDAGDITPTADLSRLTTGVLGLGGQEHTDAVTLTQMGWVRPRHGIVGNVANSWSAEGIFAFNLTDDGKAALEEWQSSANSNGKNEGQEPDKQPLVMMIHGSQNGKVPSIVDEIRLWCFDNGINAYKAADLPNAGRFTYAKVDDIINRANYYIVVLTPDEELTTGEFRPRPNTVIEMCRVFAKDPSLVCVLKDNKVDMPTDYSGLLVESLDNWQIVLLRELKGVGLL